jgi:hypothetical protein
LLVVCVSLSGLVLAAGATPTATGVAQTDSSSPTVLAQSSAATAIDGENVTTGPGETVAVTYDVTNTGSGESAALVEFTDVPSNVSLDDVSGDVSQDLLSSSPPGVITSSLAAGDTTTVTATYRVGPNPPEELSVTARARFSTGDQTVSGSDTSTISVQRRSVVSAQTERASIEAGSTGAVTVQVNNTAGQTNAALVEFTDLPANVSVAGASGDVGQDLLGSTPPGIVTGQIPAGGSTTVTVELAADASAPVGAAGAFTVTGTVQGSETRSTSTDVSVTVTANITQRFGGGDNKVDNVDVLSAVNAANSGQEVGGEPVGNLDILQLVNKVQS